MTQSNGGSRRGRGEPGGPGRPGGHPGLSLTPVSGLLVAAGSSALVVGVAAVFFYGDFPPARVRNSVAMWIIAGVAAVTAVAVRRRIADGEVGQDRSQMDPVFIARAAVLGKACSWLGAFVGGGYLGLAVYVLVEYSSLLAAQDDTPGVVACVASGVAVAVAGVVLERCCLVPPGDADPDGRRSGAEAM
ncbi:DUF3180 domain-containing protein [uncultured Corynebacterium sp.]|uniref:DUF3180 domain-containing protein n=1 Tax=uncultured Corynebacterium sp. TaxID=159447 RepID=UPI0025FA9A77|nr:DUF3180 domain-containing protein [uncultured Corynebacterium sp.]